MGNFLSNPSASSDSLTPHGVSPTTHGLSALTADILNLAITSQVPDGLSQHVSSAKRAQLNWYKKLTEAWRNARPPPRTPEEATRLIVKTLKNHHKADVEGLLTFYGLPLPMSLPLSVKFEMQTLPVDAKEVSNGDTMNVYVNTTDLMESSVVPMEVTRAVAQRAEARSKKNYANADELYDQIVRHGYRVLNIQNEEVLGRKYRIILWGIDAPESSMPYGKEAKAELLKLVDGRRLRVLVYDVDRYGRSIGDVYINGVFVQEVLLKKGLAWHYTPYDRRPELAKWEQEARAKRVGLWASKNPDKPWEYRKKQRAENYWKSIGPRRAACIMVRHLRSTLLRCRWCH